MLENPVKNGSAFRVGLLDAKGRDEDVDDDYDEDESRGDVLHDVQPVVVAFIVQIPFN